MEKEIRNYELKLVELERRLDENNLLDMVFKETLEDTFGLLAQAYLNKNYEQYRILSSKFENALQSTWSYLL